MQEPKQLVVLQSKDAGYSAVGEWSASAISMRVALSLFKKSLKNPSNYLRIVKGYLKFCIEHHLSITENSVNFYTKDKPGNLVSPVRKFLKFAQSNAITAVVADRGKEIPSENPLIAAFIADAKTLRGAHSAQDYKRVLNNFFAYKDERGLSFNGSVVNAYIMELKTKGRSVFTLNTYLSVIRQFGRWMVKNSMRLNLDLSSSQLSGISDIDNIKKFSTDAKFYKDSLSAEERLLLMEAIDHNRDKAIIALMVYSGLRSVELLRLRIKDVDIPGSVLHVLGKGKSTREPVKLFSQASLAIEAYVQEEGLERAGREEKLFPFLISTRQVRYITGKYFKKAGLAREHLSTHSLRHTAGQLLLASKVNPIYVQRQLRHKDFKTTQFYVAKQIENEFLNSMPNEG